MAVAFDAVGPAGGGGATNSTGAALSWTHTCGGSATYLLVGCTLDASPDGAFSMTATYNGVTMTSLGVLHANGATAGFLQVWQMANPPTGAHTVTVTPAGGTASGLNGGSLSFNGAGGLSATQTATGSTSTASLSFTGSSAGNMVAMFLGDGNPPTSTAGTSRFLFTGDNVHECGNAAASTVAGGGTVTCTWTATALAYAIIAVEVQVPPNPGPVFYPAVKPIRAPVPQRRRGGRVASNRGAPVNNPPTPPGTVVNQWAATFTQPTSFGTTPPALESVVVALNNSTSVGGGTGTPAAGNWLFCMVAMNESATTAGFTVAVNDDIRSFWRPGDETSSTWAVSTGTALTRTAVWYTPNTAHAAGNIYVAPNGSFDALAVLVIEVAGLGPWDTVTGINTNYAAAATSLALSLGAPSGQALIIGAVGGDNTTTGQAFAPGGWTALHTVTVTDGSDHLCDAVLTAACITTSGSVSVSGTSSSATDLSGVLLGVLIDAPSPVPANQNPAWPYMKMEVALGAGFQTPPDQLTWTDITNRAWNWDESTGTQYQLNQVRASSVNLELDNYDGALSYDNASGPYYGSLNTGNPIRIRAAAGTLGGAVFNRWYVIQKNAQEWPQEITDIHRRYAPVTATDIWSVMSAPCFTPYRGEVYEDAPYAWWPCDDQPLTAGVLPTSLRNAAPGNTNVLNIVLSPNGATSLFYYDTHGDSTAPGPPFIAPLPPSLAVYTVGANAGWMYGDPQSSQAAYGTSSPVTANPGSASWQALGQAGNTGSYGWFLSCNDTSFPALSGGTTIECWFNYVFYGGPEFQNPSGANYYSVLQQPYAAQTILELATGSHPVAVLQLDQATGHLNLITYNGSTPTSHSIYTSSDLRTQSWHMATVTLTTTTWHVLVDGGATADVSGSATGMTSAWTWLIANGDLGSNGGTSAGTGLVNGGNMSISHLAIYTGLLPAWRTIAHYWAGITGFGKIPAPGGVAVKWGPTAPDGSSPHGAAYNATGGIAASAVVTANTPGGYTSGPSAWSSAAVWDGGVDQVLWVGWTGVAPSFNIYTATAVGSEAEASVASGSGDAYNSGFGAGAAGVGASHVSSGSGASPPASGSTVGDTAAQRIERCLAYGSMTYPGRCVDPAALLVQAGTDVGGQASANNVTSIAQSDGGLLYVDSQGNLTYWQKSHLASQYSSPAWTLGPAANGATVIPYARTIRWTADPQRVWTFIAITPFAPDGSQLAIIEPTNAAGVNAAQRQYGAQPLPITSYLQSTTEMQTQASWLFTNFGQLQIRAESVRVDAASYPAAWALVLGCSVGDVVSAQNWEIGGGGNTATFRISGIRRHLSFAGQSGQVEGSVELQLDWEPSSYWT